MKTTSSGKLRDVEMLVLEKRLNSNCPNTNSNVVTFKARVDNGINLIGNMSRDEKYSLKQRDSSTVMSVLTKNKMRHLNLLTHLTM